MEWHSDHLVDGSGATKGSQCWGHRISAMKTVFEWPRLKLTTTGSNGSSQGDYPASAFLGVNHKLRGSNTLDGSYYDLVRAFASDGTHELLKNLDESADPPTGTEFSSFFT